MTTLIPKFDLKDGGATPTGAINRPINEKLSEIVSVKDFGAIGDNATNDTTAIQNALNSGLDVYIPDGTYLISATLTCSTQGAKITASPGAILKKTATFDGIVVTGSNWELIGVRVNSNTFGGSGIGIKGSNNLVQGCEVYGSTGQLNAHGVYLDGQTTTCIYNRITNCWIHQVGGVGLSSNTAPDNIRDLNVIYQSDLEGITMDVASYRTSIVGNYINASCQVGGVGGIGIDGGNNGTVTGNVINSTGSSLAGIKFQNNIISTNFVTISSNVITNNAGGGVWLFNNTGSGFISASNSIIGNTFQNNTGFDIKIDSGCVANSVAGNNANAVIIDSNAGGVNVKSGILCSFRAYVNTLQSNVTGDGTVYQVLFGATNSNNGLDFSTSTSTFTAPVTGMYQLSSYIKTSGGTSSTASALQIVQSGSTSQTAQSGVDNASGVGICNIGVTDLFAMQAGDTAIVNLIAYGSTKTMSIPTGITTAFFSGILVG